MNIIQQICESFTTSSFSPKDDSTEYIILTMHYSKTLETLLEQLNEEQAPLLLEAEAQRNLIDAMDEDRFFRFGFQTGAKLMIELFTRKYP